MADERTLTVGSSRFESVRALIMLCALLLGCIWMLASFAYYHEPNIALYAMFLAGSFLSGWGVWLAWLRITNPATLTFDPSCLTLSYAGFTDVWRWGEIETAWVVPLRPYPHVVLALKPLRPSGIVPLEVHLTHNFQMSAKSIQDEIKRWIRAPEANANPSSSPRT
jgi:hypothetical protein